MLLVSAVLVLHRHDWIRIWSAWHCRSERRTSCGLWRIGELLHWPSLTLKWWSHGITATLVLRSELWVRGREAAHLLLLVVLIIGATSSSTSLWLEPTAALCRTGLIIHITLRRLRRLSKMTSLLVCRCEVGMRARCLSDVTIAIATKTSERDAIAALSQS